MPHLPFRHVLRAPAPRPRIAATIGVVVALLGALLTPAASLHAQVIETPVPFDTDGRVLVITPALQARLALGADVLPLPAEYREARLFAIQGGEFVLVAQLASGAVQRISMSTAARATLRTATDAALVAARNPVSMDSPTTVSEPVRGHFVVNQTLLGLGLYGPAAAWLVSDPLGSSAAYLAVAGGTFFWAYGLSRSATITNAQNHMSWHFARKGAGAAMATTYAFAGDGADDQAYAAAMLVGGIGGAVAGLKMGRPYTDAEAHAMTFGSTMATVTALGTMAALSMTGDDDATQLEAAAGVGAAVAGLPLGLRYARRAAYMITAGDVGTMVTTGLLGAGTMLTAVGDESVDENAIIATTAAGALAGVVVGDRLLVRRFDHTVAESHLLRVGAGAGALLGLAVAVLFEPEDPRPVWGLATAGGVLGTIATHSLMGPRRATGRTAPQPEVLPRRSETGAASTRRGVDVRFHLDGAAFAALGAPGRHSLLQVTF